MDVQLLLAKVSASSIAISSCFLYATTRSTRFVLEIRFYALVAVVWTILFWSWAFYRLILRPKYLSILRHLPEPTENRSWWNGHASREYIGMKGSMIIEWQQQLKHNGMFRYLGMFNSERVVITTPDAVAELMARGKYDFPKTKMLEKLVAPIIGMGLVVVNGDEHTRQRRLLTPVFSMKHMRALEPVFWEKSTEIMEKFDGIVSDTQTASGFSEPINVDFYTGLVGLDIITKAALGQDWKSIENPDSELVANYREVFEPTTLFRVLSIARFVIPMKWMEILPFRRVKGLVRALELLHAKLHEEIDRKKALLEKGELKTDDIISCIMRDRHCTDGDELVTHMLTMLGAGHETVAVSVTWAMYEFCRSPEWQRSIRAEIVSKLPSPKSGEVPDFAAFEAQHMPLLNAFVSEVLRYWPSIPLTSRSASLDTTLQDLRIPATTKICFSVVAFNRDPANWGPDGARFDPARWLDKDETTGELVFNGTGGALHKTAFQTFLHGQRACIGRVFARQQMLNVLACWVGRMEFVLTDVKQVDERVIKISGAGITSRPMNGMYMHARRLEGW